MVTHETTKHVGGRLNTTTMHYIDARLVDPDASDSEEEKDERPLAFTKPPELEQPCVGAQTNLKFAGMLFANAEIALDES